jgi:hypothetical protein
LFLRRDGPQVTYLLVDLHKISDQEVELTVIGEFLLHLPQFWSRMQFSGLALAIYLGHQEVPGAMSRMLRVGTGTVRLAATTEGDCNGTAAEVSNFSHAVEYLGSLDLQLLKIFGHRQPSLWLY